MDESYISKATTYAVVTMAVHPICTRRLNISTSMLNIFIHVELAISNYTNSTTMRRNEIGNHWLHRHTCYLIRPLTNTTRRLGISASNMRFGTND